MEEDRQRALSTCLPASTEAEHVGDEVALSAFDPLSGVVSDHFAGFGAGFHSLAVDDRRGRALVAALPAWALFPGEVAYVWHGALHATTVAESLAACGFAICRQIIWAKERLVLSRGDYHWQHEPCWYAVREKSKGLGGKDAVLR